MPDATMPGTADRIIQSPRPSQPEKAQIAVDETHPRHRNFQIENALTDEHGDNVKLKKGAHVEVTVRAEKIRTTFASVRFPTLFDLLFRPLHVLL